ncbi:hypothetical protein N7495_000844 [Penicillium taxi]|uniref:uncharacterized protein n=1 Tax=Penicillium taxi TaxID=168475 RepID=UPI0025459EAD|nr:uncharacterized protein N7495_000844 [Penicillium taxi]KAJ5908162.1 hypothetical protein N7495_000844 [Penicillium taxi]
MADVWYCCDCSFGPHSQSIHDACTGCGRKRCSKCEAGNHSINTSHSHLHSHPQYYPNSDSDSDSEPDCDHDTIPYPSAVVPIMPHTSTTSNLHVHSLSRPSMPSSPSGGFRTHGGSYMYICCHCKDGPKVYDVQPHMVYLMYPSANSVKEVVIMIQ